MNNTQMIYLFGLCVINILQVMVGDGFGQKVEIVGISTVL